MTDWRDDARAMHPEHADAPAPCVACNQPPDVLLRADGTVAASFEAHRVGCPLAPGRLVEEPRA